MVRAKSCMKFSMTSALFNSLISCSWLHHGGRMDEYVPLRWIFNAFGEEDDFVFIASIKSRKLFHYSLFQAGRGTCEVATVGNLAYDYWPVSKALQILAYNVIHLIISSSLLLLLFLYRNALTIIFLIFYQPFSSLLILHCLV